MLRYAPLILTALACPLYPSYHRTTYTTPQDLYRNASLAHMHNRMAIIEAGRRHAYHDAHHETPQKLIGGIYELLHAHSVEGIATCCAFITNPYKRSYFEKALNDLAQAKHLSRRPCTCNEKTILISSNVPTHHPLASTYSVVLATLMQAMGMHGKCHLVFDLQQKQPFNVDILANHGGTCISGTINIRGDVGLLLRLPSAFIEGAFMHELGHFYGHDTKQHLHIINHLYIKAFCDAAKKSFAPYVFHGINTAHSKILHAQEFYADIIGITTNPQQKSSNLLFTLTHPLSYQSYLCPTHPDNASRIFLISYVKTLQESPQQLPPGLALLDYPLFSMIK